LEKELHVQLIYRSTKEFLPTKSGKLFYEYAKDMLSLREKSISSLKNFSDCATGNVGILASSVPAQYILPEMLGAIHKLYPNITFSLEQMDTADVVKGISSHKGEVGFVGAKIENSKCVYTDFMSEKLTLIAPNEDRFQKISTGNIPQILRGEYFVMREFGSGTRLEYEGFFKKIGVKLGDLKVAAYLDNTQSIIHAVASGLGLSFVSELAAKHYIEQKMVIPISLDCLPERNFYIIQRKNCAVTPTVDLFVNFSRSYARKYGDRRLAG
jgi:DNA-binding transcriptional LysR family regulator